MLAVRRVSSLDSVHSDDGSGIFNMGVVAKPDPHACQPSLHAHACGCACASRERDLTHADETVWNGPFYFVQAADTQLGFTSDPTWGGTGDGSDWSEDIALAERLVSCVNALLPRPRFLVVCGDLVHAAPSGLTPPSQGGKASVARYQSHERFRKQNQDFKRIMARLEIPLVCVCGNHDVGDRPTPESISQYTRIHGDDYFGFWCGGMRALVLNSQLFSDSADAKMEQEEQERWLEAQLAALTVKPPRHTVVFQHQPWFLRSETEPQEGYFNLALESRKVWLERMKEAGVSKVFAGHYHRNSGGFTHDGRLEVVVTSAVGRQMSEAEVKVNAPLLDQPSDTSSGMRIVRVDESDIQHQYFSFEELETVLGRLDKGNNLRL